ncbi:MAG: nucleotidyltransferase family protein [Candidatus Electrothrix sp. AW3_4]|nr:nucleotidyltransferase family protein [Candidatus Electrothrix gigas]
MQAMLLAAGFGTRLRPYTLVRPKPLFPVCNIPLLHILLDKLVDAGCDRIVVNCHYLADQIKEAVERRPEVILQYEKEVLGTGGGLRKALEHFQDQPDTPVLVMNGDIFHDIDLAHLIAKHVTAKNAVTMALHHYPRFHSVQVQQDRVQGFTTGTGKEEENLLAFTGIHVVNQEILRQIPTACFFHIIDLYQEIAKAGKIGYTRVDGSFWQDMGTPDDYLDLHRHLLASQTPSWQIHESAVVGKNVVLKDWGVIGPRAVIGEGAKLAQCVVWEGAEVAGGEEFADKIIISDTA